MDCNLIAMRMIHVRRWIVHIINRIWFQILVPFEQTRFQIVSRAEESNFQVRGGYKGRSIFGMKIQTIWINFSLQTPRDQDLSVLSATNPNKCPQTSKTGIKIL